MAQLLILSTAVKSEGQMIRANFVLALRYELQVAAQLGKSPSHTRVAVSLGMDRHSIRRRMKKYGISFGSPEIVGVIGVADGQVDAAKTL